MSDLIDRQAAIDAMNAWDWQELYLPIHFKQLLEELPSAERHGRWLRPRPVPQVWSLFMADCSVCGKITYMGDYCMECGARMERE